MRHVQPKRYSVAVTAWVLFGVIVVALAQPAWAQQRHLVLYSGRSKSLVEPLVEQFTKQTGIDVKARYGKTAALVLALQEESSSSAADVFWAQDAGALGAVAKVGLFDRLPHDIIAVVPATFANPSGYWVATSGRARVLAYAPARVAQTDLPDTIFNLTDPKWKNRVGWAPTNGSFLAFVTAMRVKHGHKKTRQWLIDMKRNGTRRYAKNTPILRALAAGEIDLGLSNHYYLLRFKKADKDFPVAQRFFGAGDIGNLVNVAGTGVLKAGKNRIAARRFVRFLLSPRAQQFFTSQIFEYPVIEGVIENPRMVKSSELAKRVPDVMLDELSDLAGTRKLLREVGLK